MTMKFRQLPDRFVAEKDGEIVFDTQSFPVQFFGADQEILRTGEVITFPDAVKGNAYAYGRGTIGGSLNTGCSSYITIGPQEWSHDTELGTVPEGTDILLVQVKLTRTTNPSQILSQTIPVCIEQGKWVNASGGITIEALDPMVRMLLFFITNDWKVIMRQKQSVLKKNYTFWRSDNNPDLQGWTYGGSAGRYGHIVHGPIQSQGPFNDISGNNNKRGSGSQCSLTDPTNYTSVYTGDIKIIPGIHRLDVETTGGGASNRFFSFNGTYNGSGTSFSTTADLGEEATDRVIVVVGHAMHASTVNNARRIEDCTIGGISATRHIRQSLEQNYSGSNYANVSSAIYSLLVPSGTSATIAVTSNVTQQYLGFAVYSLYNLSSATPTATAGDTVDFGSSEVLNAPVTVANDGSIVIGGACSRHTGSLSKLAYLHGVENIIVEYPGGSDTAPQFASAFQYSNIGTTELTTSGSPMNMPETAMTLAAFF